MSNVQTRATAENSLVLRRSYAAPRERVFDAWLDPALLRRFIAPEGCSVVTVSLDPRPRGKFAITLGTAEGEMTARGEYLEIRRPERMAFSWKWDEDDPSQEHESRVTLEFHQREGVTELVLMHEELRDAISRDRHAQGWASIADNLERALSPAFRICGLDLSGYMVKDAVRAIAFYRDVLGLEPTRLYPQNRGAEYELPDGTTFGLWGGAGDVMPFQPGNGILFAVDDLVAAVAALRKRDIPILKEIELPGCTMAVIGDTEGNTIFLHRRK